MNKKDPPPTFFETKMDYELTKEQVIEALRQYTGLEDGLVTFDITPRRQLRGATVKVNRLEIKG
jgi:hypothetical protein